MKQWWRNRRPFFVSGIIYALARFIGGTMRVKLVHFECLGDLRGGRIYCGWHGHSFVPAMYFRKRGYWVIISQSRDGEIQNRIFSKLGYNIIRGSTGRGGARALIESIRVLKQGACMAITPDGPRGPSGVIQEGIMRMAQKSGCALIPVGTYAKPAWFAPTWDRYMMPLPFSRAIFVFGQPMFVADSATPEQVEQQRLKLQDQIHQLQAEAKELL